LGPLREENDMNLWERVRPVLAVALLGLLGANLLATLSTQQDLKQSLTQLQNSQQQLNKALTENQEQLEQLSSHLQSELERQASLFSESSSMAAYSPEGLLVTTTLSPKEYQTNSKITVTYSVNGQSVTYEATQNGSEFSASGLVPFCETVEISAAISTDEAINQEPLPALFCPTLLSFDAYSSYSYSENLLYFTLSNSQSPQLLESLESISLAVLREGAVVGVVYPQAIESSQLPEAMKGGNAALCYQADLSPFLTLEGDFQVVPRFQCSTGLNYAQEPMFLFTASTQGLSNYESGTTWYPPVFATK